MRLTEAVPTEYIENAKQLRKAFENAGYVIRGINYTSDGLEFKVRNNKLGKYFRINISQYR